MLLNIALLHCCRTGNRTPIDGTRNRSPTFRRSGKGFDFGKSGHRFLFPAFCYSGGTIVPEFEEDSSVLTHCTPLPSTPSGGLELAGIVVVSHSHFEYGGF